MSIFGKLDRNTAALLRGDDPETAGSAEYPVSGMEAWLELSQDFPVSMDFKEVLVMSEEWDDLHAKLGLKHRCFEQTERCVKELERLRALYRNQYKD